MSQGSVTSIGIAYPRMMELSSLARELNNVLGAFVYPEQNGYWPLMFIGGERDVWIETTLKPREDEALNLRYLERFLRSSYGELKGILKFEGIGPLPVVVRPEAGLAGLLLDIPDWKLYPNKDPNHLAKVDHAVKCLLERWYSISPFIVAFADHEAQFDTDPLDLSGEDHPYALFALPNSEDTHSLVFYNGGWPLSPFGG